MLRRTALPSFVVALVLCGTPLLAQSAANPYPQQGSSGFPQVQPFPPGSTFGSAYPQVQQPTPQYNQTQPYPRQSSQYPHPQYQSPYQQQYQQQDYPQQQQGLPSEQQEAVADQQHGVARLSVADGQVNVRRGDTGDLVAAAINAPLLSQDHLQTSFGARAEVEFDSGAVIRVNPNTDLGFANLQYHSYQVQLGVGTMVYRVLRDTGAQAEIDTPSIAVRPAQAGEYRISVYDDGTAQITIRSGELEIVTAGGSRWLSGGQSILARGDSSNPDIEDVAAPQFDQLDGWSRERDRQMLGAQSYSYMSPEIAGGADLDANGTWVSSQYGQVWEPRNESADWAPYSDGNWAYEPYYGWTWVDAAPWGWAPFHYGRWFYNGGYGWCWWPGGVRAGGFGWSPAVVGFYGLGRGIGWVSLAPFEAPCRWWGSGFGLSFNFGGWGYGRGDLWNSYRNLSCRGGAVWASYDHFGGHPGRYAFANRSDLGRASWLNGRFPVVPNRGSYNFGGRAAFANPRLAVASQRTFFHAQGNGSVGRGNSNNYNNNYKANRGGFAGGGNLYRPSQSDGRGNSTSGWHNFGQPGNSAATRQGFYGGQQQGGAWHNFGQPEHGVPPVRGAFQSQAPSSRRGQSGSYGSGLPQVHYGNPARGEPSYSAPHYNAPSYNGAPRYSPPSYSAPHFSAPHFSAPAQHYSAPASPHYSAPRAGGGGAGNHGGGGGHHR